MFQAMSQRLRHLITRHRHVNWALADQAVVSASNFITGVLLARFLGPQAFGLFVLLHAAMLYVNSFQGALIFTPMVSAVPQLPVHRRAPYLQGVFALQLGLALTLAGSVVGIGVLAGPVAGLEVASSLTPEILVALGCAMLGFQFQEWQRRYYFVHEDARAAFANDLISYGGQTLLLTVIGLGGHLDVAMALWVIAATTSSAFIVGCLHVRVRPMFTHAREVLKEGWRVGRDYLAAWQMQWLGSQGVLLVGAGVVGTQAAGGVRAAQNIVGPINILFLAMENVVPVVAARRYAEGGLSALIGYLRRIVVVGTLLLLPVLGFLALFSEPLMRLVYGEVYVAAAALVVWQAVSMFLQFYLRQTFFFLRTVTATGAVIRAGVVMAAAGIGAALLLVEKYHETGVMLSLLSGTAAGLIYSLYAARRIVRQLLAGTPAEVDTPAGPVLGAEAKP